MRIFATKHSKSGKNNKVLGFTIIETLIVIAIAGLIMVIVFIAVSELSANRRDNARRAYAGEVLEALTEYYKNNSKFPDCKEVPPAFADPGCNSQPGKDLGIKFLTSYMPDGSEPSSGEKYNSATSASDVHDYTNLTATSPCTHGVSTGTNNLVIDCYDINDVEHNFTTIAPGQISIAFGHWCYNSKPDGAKTVLAGDDTDKTRAVVLIGLEHGKYYCLDNYTNN